MNSTYHDKVFEYIQTYPKIGDLVTFNGGKAAPGSVQLETVDGDRVVARDICGGETVEYSFMMICYFPYSVVPFSKQNIENIAKVQEFMNWVDEQNRVGNLPDLEGVTVLSIENAMNMPDVSGYDPNSRLAKYMFGVKITYETLPE